MNKAPCMNCKDRYKGCHNQCNKYKEYRKRIDDKNNKIAENFEYRCYIADVFKGGQA